MEYLNRIELRGIVGRAEIKKVGGTAVCRFSLLTQRTFKDKSGFATIEDTWHNCHVWQSSGLPALETIEKGAWLECDGRLRQTRYTNPEGVERHLDEVLVNNFKVLPREESAK